jgi:hypothetical protein
MAIAGSETGGVASEPLAHEGVDDRKKMSG